MPISSVAGPNCRSRDLKLRKLPSLSLARFTEVIISHLFFPVAKTEEGADFIGEVSLAKKMGRESSKQPDPKN